MFLRFLLLNCLLMLPVCHLQAATAKADPELAQKLVDGVYRPLHSRFADLSASYARDFNDLCEKRASSSAYRLQADFTKVLEAFSAIELFRLGPLLEDNLKNRLFYWPDKRRVGERQLKKLLADENGATISVDELAQKSVALQGFSALERLLFTTNLHPLEVKPQCHLIPVVIQNIAEMASKLDKAWLADSDYTRSMLQPHTDSEHFRTPDEVMRSVYTQAKVGLDIVLNDKLAPLVSNEPKRMASAPMWLSQRPIANLTGNLQALRALLLDSGLLANTKFQEELSIEFDYIDHVLEKLKPTVYLQQDSGELKRETRILLNQLTGVVAGVRYVVSVKVANALGVRAGYNSEDGD